VEAEELLNQAFEHGYSNATSSFSRLLKQKVGYSNLYGSTLRMNGKASLQILTVKVLMPYLQQRYLAM
jgi:hypothetical protein